jgi:hypothetical protein
VPLSAVPATTAAGVGHWIVGTFCAPAAVTVRETLPVACLYSDVSEGVNVTESITVPEVLSTVPDAGV